MTLRVLLEEEIKKVIGEDVPFTVTKSPRSELGDYATNAAFLLAANKRQNPHAVAETLARELKKKKGISSIVSDIKVEGGFINFFLNNSFLVDALRRFIKGGARFPKKKEKILVEYPSPNIGKPLSIAHIRSAILGDSLARIYKVLGYRVVRDDHLGDWGLQVGILIAAVKLFSKKTPEKLTLQDTLSLYVKFHDAMAEHDELRAKAKLELADLQNGRQESMRIWRVIKKNSVAEFKKSYKRLGIRVDCMLGESTYRDLLPLVVSRALKGGIARKSEGAVIIPLEEAKLPPVIIQKQDDGYLYHTFDLATIYWRKRHFNPLRVLYVVANEQALHFVQLFLASQKLGLAHPGELVHVKFGLIRGKDLKRLSTRRGKTISLDEVLDEAIARARKIAEKKNPSLSEKEKKAIAEKVGIGALKYNDLSQNRNTDIIFDWGKMLSLKGNSAPYLQYTYARLRSIWRKARAPRLKYQQADLSLLAEPEELALVKKTLEFPEAIEDAAKEYSPNLLCNYLWALADLVNTFYEKYPVLKADQEIRGARLVLIEAVANALKEGLLTLGIDTPERV